MNEIMEPNLTIQSLNGVDIVSLNDYLYNKKCIFIEGEITPSLVNSIMKQLMVIKDEEASEDYKVTVYISSLGGDVPSGLNLYAMLQKFKVRTVNLGTCASMGALLFLAGEEREMMSQSRLLFHEPFAPRLVNCKIDDLKSTVRDMEMYKKTISKIIVDKSDMTMAKVEKMLEKNTWFSADEALKAGIATKII